MTQLRMIPRVLLGLVVTVAAFAVMLALWDVGTAHVYQCFGNDGKEIRHAVDELDGTMGLVLGRSHNPAGLACGTFSGKGGTVFRDVGFFENEARQAMIVVGALTVASLYIRALIALGVFRRFANFKAPWVPLAKKNAEKRGPGS